MINLDDAKVSYEDQTFPAIHLIGKLKTELREAASRITAIAETLENLHAALLNSHTLEVKLTLSKEEYNKFKSLGGRDDHERIREAVMGMIHPEKTASPSDSPRSGALPNFPGSSSPQPVEPRSETPQPSESIPSPDPGPQTAGRGLLKQPIAEETATKKKLITKCPTCQSLIDLPEASNDQWPVELKCANCGSKCLVKPNLRTP